MEVNPEIYRALVIASGLRLYARTGMKPNRAYTPMAMMIAARHITGWHGESRDYEGAAKALTEFAEKRKQELQEKWNAPIPS